MEYTICPKGCKDQIAVWRNWSPFSRGPESRLITGRDLGVVAFFENGLFGNREKTPPPLLRYSAAKR